MNIHCKRFFLLLVSWVCLSSAVLGASEIVVNPENEELLGEERLRLMLTGKEKFWSSGSEVVIAIHKEDLSVDDTLLRYSGMTFNKFKNHWQRIAFSGRGKMPRVFSNIDDLVDFVKKNNGAIGISSANDNLTELRQIDLGVIMISDESDKFVTSGR